MTNTFKSYIKHFITICKHKYYVGKECFKLKLYWQGITHDLSKFSYTEFLSSAKYFQGNCSPILAEKIEKGYSLAWLNHKSKNKHHWEYWIDFMDGNIISIEIPNKYLKEMFCDYIGASKAYNKNFKPNMPLEYFNTNSKSANCYMHKNSVEKLRKMLEEYANNN
jgi:hypothetical protein